VPATNLYAPEISEFPSSLDVAVAVAVIDEVFADFPFVNRASRANAIGLLVTIVTRPAIEGLVPLALLDKPSPGTGATLLAKVIAAIATGRSASLMTAPRSEEEWRKKITATLLEGPLIVLIDNVRGALESDSLSMALTTDVWKDRRFGVSEMVEVPQHAVWIATGNNLRVAGDVARRSYWVRIDAKLAQAWRRDKTHFRHPKLLKWVNQHRGALLAAVFTIARAWFAAGKPLVELPTLGGYEEWSETIGAMLAYAGIPGFLENLEELYADIDDEATEWEGIPNGVA
jgi:hypothetical protein